MVSFLCLYLDFIMLVVFDTSGQNMFELSLYFALLTSRHMPFFVKMCFICFG